MAAASAKFWIPEHLQILRDMAATGHNSQQIARVLGRSQTAVVCRANLIGVFFSLQQRWSEQDIATVKEMWAAGETASTIGKVLGRSRNAVCGYIDRNNLSARKTKARTKSNPIRQGSLPPRKPADRRAVHPLNRYVATGADSAPAQSAPIPFTPRQPMPWIQATGCQWHVDIRKNLQAGEHRTMIVCNEPRMTGKRFCEHHFKNYFHQSSHRLRAA